jgi:chromosome segregation ATPase
MEEEGMKTFAQEFTQIFDAFFKAHVHEEELVKENDILQTQVENYISRVAVAEKLTAANKEVINQLKHEIEQAWKMADSAHDREKHSQEVIERLSQQLDQLNAETEHSAQIQLYQSKE